jgi:hypothetical protein
MPPDRNSPVSAKDTSLRSRETIARKQVSADQIIRKTQTKPIMTTTIDQLIETGICQGKTISLHYQGNPRRIIPLVFGLLKNGKEAVLCFKINGIDEDGPDLSIRLYHLHKITQPRINEESLPFSRKIDYYLTKHFRKVYVKV